MSKEKYEVYEQCLIIYLGEEVDHHRATQIKIETEEIMEKKFIKFIVFDFSRVKFMDSSGIGMIMGRYKRVQCFKGNVIVTGVKTTVDRILRMSGLYKLVHVYSNVEEALGALYTEGDYSHFEITC